jgi:hypothetical protein
MFLACNIVSFVTGTVKRNEGVATLVHYKLAFSALVALLAKQTPHELGAVSAEGRLWEVGRQELMTTNFVDLSMNRITSLELVLCV